MQRNERYYISSGALNKMYTLRLRFQEPVYVRNSYGVAAIGGMVDRDWYVKSLATDKKRAIEKAQEFLPANYEIKFDLGEIVRGEGQENYSPANAIGFGKYSGKTVEEVKEIDPAYLIWVCDNFASKKHQQAIDYIKMVMQPELDQRANEYKAEQVVEEELRVERSAILKAISAELVKLSWDFPQNIGQDMINGSLPKGRGRHLVCDMMGKIQGRRNSKKYKAEYVRVEGVLEEAEAI